jgi:hypothetical protein
MSNRHEVDLDAVSILATAQDETGIPMADEGFRERLGRVVAAYHAAGLDPVDQSVAAEALTEIVVVRSRLERDRGEQPGIAAEVVSQPIIVVGFPRAGTTFLHALLAADPGNRPPQWWEVMHPSPPPGLATGDDHRRQLAQREVADFVRRCPGVRVAHPYFVEGDATVMECESIFTFDLRNTYPFALHRVPAFLELDLLGDPSETFAFHHDFLRQLQFGREPRRWALKGTAHQFLLPALLATYPDAVVLWPHRDPAVLIASTTVLMAALIEGVTGQQPDQVHVARALMDGMRMGLTAALADPSIDAENVVHLRYGDITGDPLGQLRAVYERFSMPFTPAFEAAGHGWMDDERHRSDRYGKFSYDLERLGLQAGEVQSAFADYIERFAIDR